MPVSQAAQAALEACFFRELRARKALLDPSVLQRGRCELVPRVEGVADGGRADALGDRALEKPDIGYRLSWRVRVDANVAGRGRKELVVFGDELAVQEQPNGLLVDLGSDLVGPTHFDAQRAPLKALPEVSVDADGQVVEGRDLQTDAMRRKMRCWLEHVVLGPHDRQIAGAFAVQDLAVELEGDAGGQALLVKKQAPISTLADEPLLVALERALGNGDPVFPIAVVAERFAH